MKKKRRRKAVKRQYRTLIGFGPPRRVLDNRGPYISVFGAVNVEPTPPNWW